MSTNTSSDPAPTRVRPLIDLSPGKIVAVHLSYRSRAEQRGRTPAAPSYFLKPPSSLAYSSDPVIRPAGTELLVFEGEIALIIGESCRKTTAEKAWSHVAWVTAANDWGLYDLRQNDSGSNLRSKGRDGFTPIGPAFIDATGLDPEQLRLRTWRNGALVQDDESGNLLFPFVQIIADLSQHMTLEPGDVILTGTPAGSSVAQPDDVVEVEVDSPRAPGAPTTGRLVSYVVQGTEPFDPSLGSSPAVDDKQREEAWGSRELAGLSAAAKETGLDPDLRAKLEKTPVAALSQQLRKRGLDHVAIDGVRPIRRGARLVGVAKTLRFVPFREDLFDSHGGGYNAQKRAFDAAAEGEVIVIEARGDSTAGTLGDILALRAQARGAAGIVTDGGVRDFAAVVDIGLPVFASGPHPAVLGRRHVPWDVDVTIACGGATVQPGDVIVGDDDGVIVIPPGLVHEVVDAAAAQEVEDAWIADQVRAGEAIEGLFPMNSTWREAYSRSLSERT